MVVTTLMGKLLLSRCVQRLLRVLKCIFPQVRNVLLTSIVPTVLITGPYRYCYTGIVIASPLLEGGSNREIT